MITPEHKKEIEDLRVRLQGLPEDIAQLAMRAKMRIIAERYFYAGKAYGWSTYPDKNT